MRWCSTCGERYKGTEHNCGYARISNDRLRELEAAERRLVAEDARRNNPSDKQEQR